MIFFKILILLSSFFASTVNNFKKQIIFNYLFTASMLILLIINAHYVFSFVFIISELLLNKLLILCNNNSVKASYPSFKTFKKDYKKYLLGILISLLCLQTYYIFKDFGKEASYQLTSQYDFFVSSLPLFAVSIFILTIARWNKHD